MIHGTSEFLCADEVCQVGFERVTSVALTDLVDESEKNTTTKPTTTSVSLSVSLSLCFIVFLSVFLPLSNVYLSICLSAGPFVLLECLSRLSVCLGVFLVFAFV